MDRLSKKSHYYAGTVHSYDPAEGHGYIQPDESELGELIILHYKSFRDVSMEVRPGDRVLFRFQEVPAGKSARDVHYEMVEQSIERGLDEDYVGSVISIPGSGNYGFIRLPNGKDAFFHRSYLNDPSEMPSIGARVSFRLVETARGPQAQDISLVQEDETGGIKGIGTKASSSSNEILAQALLARDQRRYDEATKLYELGLKKYPSMQLVLSYAAMEKNRGRKQDAMRIYQQGIKKYPISPKLREDAGILAASLGQYNEAIDLLKQALQISRRTGGRGEKGILLALARTFYRMDTLTSLKKAIKYYEEAETAFGSHHNRVPASDRLMMNIAKIRTQHHRGNLTVNFFQENSFPIIRANLLEQTTVGADIIVRVENNELIESYGLNKELLLRCMFKSDISFSDLESLDQAVKQAAATGLADEQVTLMIIASLPTGLQRTLFRRIEEPERNATAIVPIPQSVIESSKDASDVLRNIFDQWLYRRDLFAINFPVVGRKFFGRDKLLAELRNSIITGTPIGIFGLRKVGKTSLLKEIEIRSTEFGDIVVYMDLLRVPSDVYDVRWIYWRLADLLYERIVHSALPPITWQLGGRFRNFMEISVDFPIATAFDADLTNVFKAIEHSPVNPKPRVVILLDEIERLLPTALGKEGFTGFFDFFSYIRGVSQENNNFVVIVTGANAAISEAAQFNGRDNPVFNFFKETYLQLLELNEVGTMSKVLGNGMGIKFTQEAIEFIYFLTGGHPFFARQLCSFVASRYAERPVQINLVKVRDLVDQYLEYSGKDFAEIMARLARDYPSERYACVALAEAGGSLKIQDLVIDEEAERINLKHLLGYQIVRIQGKKASLSMDLLRRWIKRGS